MYVGLSTTEMNEGGEERERKARYGEKVRLKESHDSSINRKGGKE